MTGQPDDADNTAVAESAPSLDTRHVGNAAAAISTLALLHGVDQDAHPIDLFVTAVTRLSDAETNLDLAERQLLALARRGVVTDQERFALHAAYLRQKD